MVCSHPEWTDRYLGRLRTKFLEQEYPASLVDEGFEKAKKNKRTDLIFQNKKKKEKEKKKKKNEELPLCHLKPWKSTLSEVDKRAPANFAKRQGT